MTRLLLDSWAWIEYFAGSERGDAVRRLIESDANEVYSSTVSIVEVASKLERAGKDSEPYVGAILRLSSLIPLDAPVALAAGRIHAKMHGSQADFGLADAVVLAAARSKSAKVVTGDPHFKRIKDAVIV